jgi:hypothetical protein
MAGRTILTSLVAARWQMGFSLGWHIVLASPGVAFPALILAAEWRGFVTGLGVGAALFLSPLIVLFQRRTEGPEPSAGPGL